MSLAGCGIAAGGPAAATPPSAAAVASRVDHHYNALHSLRINFVQQYDGMGMHRREAGNLLLSKPGRMRWTYAEPAGKLFVLDGRDAYFYTPGATDVQRVPAKKLDDLRSPLRFLLGHTQLAKELTRLTVSRVGGVAGEPARAAEDATIKHLGGKGSEVFELSGTPRGMEQRILSFRLTVTADGTILGMRIEETDGAITLFTFTGEEANIPAPAAYFVFKAPPGTDIVSGLPPV